MQLSAGQDLPHTRARSLHWLVTAAAVAAVIAGAGLLRPADATATSGDGEPGATMAAPDARDATFPIDCGPNPTDVVTQKSGDLDGDGRPETVAVVRCRAGTGTPPSGVYVLAHAREAGAPPRVVATLVAPSQGLGVERLTVRDATISATLLGYSTGDVPRCCPDLRENVKWQWRNGKFARSEPSPARSV